MPKHQLSSTKLLTVGLFTVMCLLFQFNVSADELPAGVVQVWTSVEGNIKYYVKEGEKVKKGTPLFFIKTSDNNPAHFWAIQHKIEYYRVLYARRAKLLKSHAVSQEDVDTALQNLISAEDEMTSYISATEQAFYKAPFDCEIVKLLYLQHSGMGDGNPAINIRCIDKHYEFVPAPIDIKMIDLLNKRDEIIKRRKTQFKMKDVENDFL